MNTTLFLRIIQPLIFLAVFHTARPQDYSGDYIGRWELTTGRSGCVSPGGEFANWYPSGSAVVLTGETEIFKRNHWVRLDNGDWILSKGLASIKNLVSSSIPNSGLDVVKPGTFELTESRYTAEHPGFSSTNYLKAGTKIELTGDELVLDGILWSELTSGDWIVYNGLIVVETKIIDGPPPVLQIDAETISFEDENGNGKIDANENCHIIFEILNVGPGPAIGLTLETSFTGNEVGVTSNIIDVPTIQPDKKHTIHVPVISDRFTENGIVTITIEVVEPKGFSPSPFALEVETRAYEPPSLEVVDFACTATTWEANTPISLDVLIQNVGVGISELSIVELIIPSAINCYSDNKISEPQTLASGESMTLSYDMIVPRNYLQREVQVEVIVSEKYGDYGSTWRNVFPFENDTESKVIAVKSAVDEDKNDNVQRVSLNKSSGAEASVSFKDSQASFQISSIAVIPKEIITCGGQREDADALASYTENNILSHYSVADRRHLEAVLEEHRLQMSGLTFEEKFLESGCIENAEAYLFVQSNCLMGEEMIEIRLVHCETSTLIWSCTGVNATPQEVLMKINEELDRKN